MLLLVASVVLAVSSTKLASPNIVFLICESTDGRTYREGFAPVPIPNIKGLASEGVQFDTHYSNVPVCCPSRASTWSGRLPHKIPHQQMGTNLTVQGVWNNYEGLPVEYDQKIMDVMNASGYHVMISGKEDWSTGGHSLNVRLNSWTMYTRFPYNINSTGGWYDETMCSEEPTIHDNNNREVHISDWQAVNSTTQWIKTKIDEQKAAANPVPFFAYQGMVIVHPPYVTNNYWLSKIDQSKVTVPSWEPLEDIHPCDLQSSMLKKCTPSNSDSDSFYSMSRRREVRSVYYAMIAEFDAMVGEYVRTVKEGGAWDSTVFIVTSDHGDMNMEHQQFYKMVQYDASSRVPLVINAPWTRGKPPRVVTKPTSHIDLFPTIMELGNVPVARWPSVLDGTSLVGYVNDSSSVEHSQYVVSQFHGCNIAMSWYLITDGVYKLVVFGTGVEEEPQLFHLISDVAETNNIAKANPTLVKHLQAELEKVVPYQAVSLDVAKYNQDSFRLWKENNSDWKSQMSSPGLRWAVPFNVNQTASFDAIAQWLDEAPAVKSCRTGIVYPSASWGGEL
eukprot:TRINITY_DN4046_c2_g1_i2.p1 TRINITY_DN4046_c2_g1~~TRINITY_DN4046_c2_g1_i2.p1  ORF type:complete len:560 (+),score=170.94 TRINITY_DN4046_c2_g1_i2:43-1722(+)